MVTWPGVVGLGGPGGTTLMLGLVPGVLPLLLRLLARIWLKWSAADSISLLAAATSSRRPVTTNTGSAPLTGVLIYVLVFALNALILQPGTHENKRMVNKSKSFKKHDKIDYIRTTSTRYYRINIIINVLNGYLVFNIHWINNFIILCITKRIQILRYYNVSCCAGFCICIWVIIF